MLRILIVDDDVDFADSLAELISVLGHDAHTANTAETGVLLATQGGFDIVFMDVGLPGRNGADCAKEIKERQPDTKCILITGYGESWLKKMQVITNGIKLLYKPLRFDDIEAVLSA